MHHAFEAFFSSINVLSMPHSEEVPTASSTIVEDAKIMAVQGIVNVNVKLVSFGYCCGSPPASVVFSAQHLSIPKVRGASRTHFSGVSGPLRKKLLASDGVEDLLDEIHNHIIHQVKFSEGKDVCVGVGCNSGSQMSVLICEELEHELKHFRMAEGRTLQVSLCHREQGTWAHGKQTKEKRWKRMSAREKRKNGSGSVNEDEASLEDDQDEQVL